MESELQKRCSKTPPPFALQLHGVLELGCLAGKLAGVAGVQLQSHAKHPLSKDIGQLNGEASIALAY